MKNIKRIMLEVNKSGVSQYVKQSIEISDEGYIKQALYPMVYLGQVRVYDYKVEKKDIDKFLSSLDFKSWEVSKNPSSTRFSFSCKVLYSDGELLDLSGYIHNKMPKEYSDFDDSLLELIKFIEKPWLFTV